MKYFLGEELGPVFQGQQSIRTVGICLLQLELKVLFEQEAGATKLSQQLTRGVQLLDPYLQLTRSISYHHVHFHLQRQSSYQ